VSFDPLTTIEATKTWLSKSQQQVATDPQITQLIKALSAEVGRYCGRNNLGNVLSYTERYTTSAGGKPLTRDPKILLRRYPVVSLVQVQLENTIIPITTDPTGCTPGAWLDPNGERTLVLFQYRWCVPLVVQYTAGYTPLNVQGTPSTIPPDLALVVQQWIGEVLQSRQQTNQRSMSLGGQNVSFDLGEKFGMSPRTRAMLQPFMNRVPLYGN
jgi:hypothetical protein